MLQALVPIYGTKDAGRGLWRRVVRICTQEAGLKENFVFPAFYTHAVDGRIVLMLATHVDDFLWANEPEYDYLMDTIKRHLLLGKKEEISFRFTRQGVRTDHWRSRLIYDQDHMQSNDGKALRNRLSEQEQETFRFAA